MSELVPTGSRYTDEQRRQAVMEYAICGVMSHVSRNLNIPEPALCQWKQSDWWESLSKEVQTPKEEHILAQYTEITTKAGEVVMDRLENGDVRLVGGERVRVPVSARDASIIGGISFDKRRLVLNQPTSISVKSDNLEELASQFRDLARRSQEKVVSEK